MTDSPFAARVFPPLPSIAIHPPLLSTYSLPSDFTL